MDSSLSSCVKSDFSNDSLTYSNDASLLYAHTTPVDNIDSMILCVW